MGFAKERGTCLRARFCQRGISLCRMEARRRVFDRDGEDSTESVKARRGQARDKHGGSSELRRGQLFVVRGSWFVVGARKSKPSL